MKLGVNNDVNQGKKTASLRPMGGGPSKINPPNSHPSNPVHKQATQAPGLGEEHTKVKVKQVTNQVPNQNTKLVNKQTSGAPEVHTQTSTTTASSDDAPHTQTSSTDSHHLNKAIVAVGALVLAGFLLWMG